MISRLLLAAAVVLVGCRKTTATSDAAVAVPIAAELSGCDAWTARNVCEVMPEQELRVAIRGTATAPIVVDDREVAATSTDRVLTVRVAGAAKRLAIGATTFTLAPSSRPAWLREATALRRSGKLDDAARLADAHLDDPGEGRARAKGVAARIALARGNTAAAIALFRESIAIFAAAGRTSEEADDRFALSWILSQATLELDEARRVLAELEPRVATYPDGRARLAYYRAIAFAASGDVRSAMVLLERAQSEAARLGLRGDARDAEEQLALTLLDIGRAAEARKKLIALDATSASDPPCRRADLWVNLARATRADGALAAATETFTRALEIVRTTCPSELRQANIELEIALTAAEAGDWVASRAHLAASRGASKTPRLPIYLAQLDLDGRIALATGKLNDALAAFAREDDVARASSASEARWQAALGRAEALDALGRDRDARDAYLAAEAILDDVALLIPVGERRSAPFARWQRSAAGLVELLVRRGQHREALEIARRAHARTMRGLVVHSEIQALDADKRARWDGAVAAYRRVRREIEEASASDWTATAKELETRRADRAKREQDAHAALDEAMAVLARSAARNLAPLSPPDGTVVLSWHATRTGAIAFVATPKDVSAHPIGSLDRAGVEAGLLAARTALEGASRVRILPDDRLLAVDIHALSLDGVPLAERFAVEYAIDLDPAVDAAPGAALIASDPDGNLAAARAEGDEVERLLRAAGASTIHRLHQRAVTADAVLGLLPSASLFHFAGHARAGDDAWDSALSLTDGGRLTVADVLALPRTPALVVLTACEAARSVSGPGLAHAFVLAGSRAAIAPWRSVSDDLAARIARSLYTHPTRESDPALALRDAIRTLRTSSPAEDWAAFRVVVR